MGMAGSLRSETFSLSAPEGDSCRRPTADAERRGVAVAAWRGARSALPAGDRVSPTSPPKPCARMGAGCPHMRPCPVHGKRPWEHDRQSASARGYGARWGKLRPFVLRRDNYLCQSCRRAGRLALATSVDHVTPKFLGGSDDPDNLTSLCDRCRADKDAHDAAGGPTSGPEMRTIPLRMCARTKRGALRSRVLAAHLCDAPSLSPMKSGVWGP
jgi:5-methylcytosine-specific restriction protein A